MRNLVDFFVVTAVAVLFFLLSWFYSRSLNRGKALNTTQRKIVGYGFAFVLGGLYLMQLFSLFFLAPPALMFFSIAGWGATLALIAFWFHRRAKRADKT